jgi:hypothetical protein
LFAFAAAIATTGRTGCLFVHALVLRHRVMLKDFTLEDPDLDAARAIGGERGGHTVIDVRTHGVQRNAAFAIPFLASDLCAAETTGAIDADTFSPHTQGGLHGALHRAAEGYAALKLLRHTFGDQRCVKLGLAHFDDVDMNFIIRYDI